MLAYTGFLLAANRSESGVPPAALAAGRASLARTWSILKRQRSAMWNGLAVLLGQPIPEGDPAAADAVWSLRTFPLDLIDWPTRNSHRLDITVDPDLQRDYQRGDESIDVLPANERSQARWNADPHDMDGGSGLSENDPGAFLAAYWTVRYAGLLQ